MVVIEASASGQVLGKGMFLNKGIHSGSSCMFVCVCVCACMRACECACVFFPFFFKDNLTTVINTPYRHTKLSVHVSFKVV